MGHAASPAPAAAGTTADGTPGALHEAIGVISSVCDYAQKDDGRGFNAADAWLGHVLAQMPAAAWTGEEALAAWDMLRKYRGQLSAAGIDYDRLPRPDGADQLEAGRREQARERARQHARQWREQQYRKTHSYVRCDGDGDQVTLAFPCDPDLVAACRTINGRRYDGATKTNVFPFTSLPQVMGLATAHGIEVTADVRALAAIAADRAAEAAAQPQVRLDDRDGTMIIDATFDPALTDALKQANDGQSTWDRTAGVHRLPVRSAVGLPGLAERFGLRVSDQARAAITQQQGKQERNCAAASAFGADPVPVPGLADGRALKAQQYPVVRFALEHRRVLIGDDMGWGKTLSSLAAVAADGGYPAVVVCRPSLTLNWAGEIFRFFPDLSVEEARGTSPHPIPVGADVIIIGSAALAAKPRKTNDGGKEFGWVEELSKTGPKALIIDEGQDTKERGANRSQACEQLAAAVIARDGLVLDLTGTAILNRPRELCQQLTILGRITEFGGPKAFLWRYCLSETNAYGAGYNGARNLIELHERLRAWGIMIRRSDDAALGLPPCREHVLRIPAPDLDPAVMARYRQAEADLLGFLAEQARAAAQRLGQDPASAAVEAAMRACAAEHLVAINTLRQLAGQAKRGYVTGWVREHVAAGEKVMVAAHHRDQVDAYAAAFGGLKLQGGQPVTEKETVKARFQQSPAAEAPVIAVAIGAGGVGHTLTAARIGIQAEQAWTPGETQQMKKRLHRIGQDRAVDYYVTVAEGTIDEHLWAVVTAKQATLDAVLDGRSDSGTAADENSVAAELTWRLTQQGLGNPAIDGAADDGDSSSSQVTTGGRADGAPASSGPAAAQPGQTVTPAEQWTWKWSGDLIKVYAGSEIAGRIYRDQGPRGTFYRAETASDPYRSVLSDREVARHLPDIDAAVAALRAARTRGDHDAVPTAASTHSSEQRMPAPGERGTDTSEASTWVAADHGSLDRPHGPSRQDQAEADRPAVAAQRAFRSGDSTDDDVLDFIGTAGRLDPARSAVWQITRDQLRPFGPRDEITVRHWREAHVDPDKVRAWCRDTGRAEPPARGALPRDLVADYLAERGATDIAMPGGPSRAEWLARRPSLRESFTVQLGWPHGPAEPFTVVYGPCPRCGGATSALPGQALPLCLDCASQSGNHDGLPAPVTGPGEPPRDGAPDGGAADDGGGAGQPGVPVPPVPDGDDEASAQARIAGQHLRESAHRYLEDGLWPVPAWAARLNGECCCPHGGDCPRPGKHPRSVHTGPGPRDYSWKPLACRTHAEVDERFAPGGRYAAGNLMVAIPAGLMAVDRDDDDGGRAALAALAGELGELPPTLAHRTPHGEHLIYRTPPGWTGRAWVGKDPANPVPAGIDLRMPGQILMAGPSAVPGPDGPARYGPACRPGQPGSRAEASARAPRHGTRPARGRGCLGRGHPRDWRAARRTRPPLRPLPRRLWPAEPLLAAAHRPGQCLRKPETCNGAGGL